ncbi:MAG TPA: histidine phosphatase family protein, partial [Candidatus Limnocylindria bacterium]|nr:histidine phosphatase family protein [Candidatus Limnocylindria bacterium]
MPLTLELLRHGDALPAGPGGDVPRRLSPAGEQALRRLALRLAKDGWRPERVFASPLRRARDSAQLVLEPLTPPVQIEIMDELAHASEPAGILAALAKRQAVEGCVLLVGHQPLIGLLAAHL